MNNIVNMVNYYLVHKNADDSVVEYLKNKLDNSKIDELIFIQIDLLYTDPSDKLVSGLVYFINDKLNNLLVDINLFDLINIICSLKSKVDNIKYYISDLEIKNKNIFSQIRGKDLNKDNVFDNEDSKIAAALIDETQSNDFIITRKKSEIKSIEIWLKNLECSFKKKFNNSDIKTLILDYASSLTLINKDDYINEYISILSNKIETSLFSNNILNTITNIMPELDLLYKESFNEKKDIYKLLDYYIDVVDNKIKKGINDMIYEEKLILKDKINIICKEIMENDNKDDDFKVLVISSYLRYL